MDEVLLRLEELLFLSAPEIAVVSAEEDGEAIRIGVRCRAGGALCPGCAVWSSRVHGSYLRFPADLPSAGGAWCCVCMSGVSSARMLLANGERLLSSSRG